MNNNIGDVIEGVVCGIESYGIFVQFENEYRGLVHISEISNHFVKSVSDYVEMGDKLSCTILEIDHKAKKVKCSIKNSELILEKEKEMNHGFRPLKEKQNDWIEAKIAEMNKNSYE